MERENENIGVSNDPISLCSLRIPRSSWGNHIITSLLIEFHHGTSRLYYSARKKKQFKWFFVLLETTQGVWEHSYYGEKNTVFLQDPQSSRIPSLSFSALVWLLEKKEKTRLQNVIFLVIARDKSPAFRIARVTSRSCTSESSSKWIKYNCLFSSS